MNCTFVLSSVTYAMKAVRLLSREGIRAAAVKSPEVRNVRGCGYGIAVYGNCDVAKAVLDSNGIKILGAIGEKR